MGRGRGGGIFFNTENAQLEHFGIKRFMTLTNRDNKVIITSVKLCNPPVMVIICPTLLILSGSLV